MSKPQHTPTPWTTDDPHIVYGLVDDDIVYLANTNDLDTDYPTSEANAAFIVHAANNHDLLVEALSSAIDAFREPTREMMTAIGYPNYPDGWAAWGAMIDAALVPNHKVTEGGE